MFVGSVLRNGFKRNKEKRLEEKYTVTGRDTVVRFQFWFSSVGKVEK